MTETLTGAAPVPCSTYRNERDYPFCPGCGHGVILDHLNAALVKLQLDPRRVALVTDIGCQGLGDQYFVTHAFHGLHGRSIAYATGMKLADPELTVVVLIGDGGTGIGGAHLLNAARRNIGITVLVFNNFNFGMTGGEHSVTTPPGALTATTSGGNLERPLDLCATVAVNGGGLAWRGTAFDKALPDVIADALTSNGFALLDIWELCTAYYAPTNKLTRKALEAMRAELEMPAGLVHRAARPEYARALRAAGASAAGASGLVPRPVTARFPAKLAEEFRLVVAGSAGGRIKSSARLIGEAALLSGLWAAQQDDYPVTVQTGHSISELILSPREILYTGITRPDALVLVSEEGRKWAARQLRALTAESWLFTTPAFAAIETPARKVIFDPEAAGVRAGRRDLGLLLLFAALRRLDLFDIAACEEAVRLGRHGAAQSEALDILAASAALATRG